MFKELFRKKEKPFVTPSQEAIFGDLKDWQKQVKSRYENRKDTFETMPRQSGKTWIGTRIIVNEALNIPNANVLVVTVKSLNSSYLVSDIKRFLDNLGIEYRLDSNGIIFPNGSNICLRSCNSLSYKEYERGKSPKKFSLVYYDEYLFFNKKDLNDAIFNLLSFGHIDSKTNHIGLSSDPLEEKISLLKRDK